MTNNLEMGSECFYIRYHSMSYVEKRKHSALSPEGDGAKSGERGVQRYIAGESLERLSCLGFFFISQFHVPLPESDMHQDRTGWIMMQLAAVRYSVV